MTHAGDTPTASFRPAVRAANEAAAAARVRIAAAHAAGVAGREVGRLASDLFDEIVREVWRSAVADLPPASAATVQGRVALVAHGGFGRREMAPWSDIDLMILHEPAAAAPVATLARRLLQDLFDAGLEVGQSVRTVAQACRLAAEDATILSSLLDMRPLVDPAGLVAACAARLAARIRRHPARIAERLVAARREEAERYGDTTGLLEPNVKRSAGGLRDVHLVRWLGLVLHGADSPPLLADRGVLTGDEAQGLLAAHDFLMRLRNELHLDAGKAADDLTRDHQVRIAAAWGHRSEGGLLAVERFMRDLFGHTRRVSRAVDVVVPARRPAAGVTHWAAGLLAHPFDGAFRVGPREVGVVPGQLARVAGSRAAIVRLVGLAAVYDLPIERASWAAVRAAAPALPSTPDPEVSAAFLALLEQPASLASALRRLHEAGVLETIIPPFAAARDLLQFNSSHRYTVDEHCIHAVERVAEFAGDPGWLGGTWRSLVRRRPLLLALLLHDLGKGHEEDHSILGARIARDVAGRLGLPTDEAELVEFLVAEHLAMAHLAFRRDAGDDSLVVPFARKVGSPEVLRMLTLLTAADVSAVAPGMWTKWKSDLLGALSFRTLAHLDGEEPSLESERCRRAVAELLADRDAADPIAVLAAEVPPSYLASTPPERIVEELGRLARLPAGGVFVTARWQPATGTVAVTVGTSEGIAPGVFHRVTAALAVQRLEVLAADIHTFADGLVVDHFTVLDGDFAGEPPGERFTEIADAIRSALRADTAPAPPRRWNPFAPQVVRTASLPPRVLVDTSSSTTTTIVEVFAHDAAGLLSAIARTLFEHGFSVRSARIGTYLDQVVDAFHVTDAAGGKVTDAGRLAALRASLERVVGPITAPG